MKQLGRKSFIELYFCLFKNHFRCGSLSKQNVQFAFNKFITIFTWYVAKILKTLSLDFYYSL